MGGVAQPINGGSCIQLSVTPIITIWFEVRAWWLMVSLIFVIRQIRQKNIYLLFYSRQYECKNICLFFCRTCFHRSDFLLSKATKVT